ncbi:MAG: lysozyme [Pseudomonadota bacterium]
MRKYIVDDWFKALFLGYASVFNLIALAILLGAEFIYSRYGVDYDPYIIGWVAVALNLLVWFGRVIKQDVRTRVMRFAVFGIVALALGMGVGRAYAMEVGPQLVEAPERAEEVAKPDTLWGRVAPLSVPMVAKWEGKHACPDNAALHCSYLDTLPNPNLWTVCYGHTRTAQPGQRFTEADCREMLGPELREYWEGWLDAVTRFRSEIPEPVHAAAASLTYNIGIGGARKASMTTAINAGDFDDGCKRMTRYNRSGGRVIRGLVNRRQYEFGVCMTWREYT